jgi:hypothetical protein
MKVNLGKKLIGTDWMTIRKEFQEVFIFAISKMVMQQLIIK